MNLEMDYSLAFVVNVVSLETSKVCTAGPVIKANGSVQLIVILRRGLLK